MASEALFVVIGAGASCYCATDEFVRPAGHDYRPPLVKHLFASRFAAVLERNPERPVRSLAVVNADIRAAQTVAEQLARHGVVATDHNRWIFERGFNEFARGPELNRYLKWLAEARAR